MNSKSDIIDEIKSIRNLNYDKTKTLDDIIQKNLKNIENVIDSKVIDIYARPWVKLEPKLKLRKINEYIKDNINFNDDLKSKVLKYYMDKKKVNITYDIDLCCISELKTKF